MEVAVTCGPCPDHRPASSPADWWYFPDTVVEGGGPLGAIVLCVPLGDTSWTGIDLVGDLPLRLRRDLEQFVTLDQSGDRVPSGVAWCSRNRALSAIDDAAARWAATANRRG